MSALNTISRDHDRRDSVVTTRHRSTFSAFALAAVLSAGVLAAACGDKAVTAANSAGSGTLAVQLTDAPFSRDSVSRVDIFVVRVDARTADADSASSAKGAPDDSASADGWKKIATPNLSVNLLAYQNGVALPLGSATLAAGSYSGFRLVIDATKSSVTLKNGTVLSGTSSPNITFPSATRSGIKIVLAQPVAITENKTTTVLIDFMVGDSFVMRGATIAQNGLLFKPVIRGTVK